MITFLRWCFTSGIKGYIVLWLIVVVLVVAGIMIRNAVTAATTPAPTPPAPTAQPGLPTVKQAPYLVQTSSREYYAVKAVKDKAGIVTLTDYWEWRNKRWVENKGTLVLDQAFGTVTITKRR